MSRTSFLVRTVSLVTAVLLAAPLSPFAENGGAPPPQQSAPPRTLFSQEELAQMLAPIALYPDELVAQILMASTYPLEVVQADRWAKSHKQSAGAPLAKALENEPWDPSVKSLVNFPTVLSAMSEKLDVTAKIGDAFLSQQKDVMATIQMLRKKAQAAGNLKTTKEQTVVVEKETIIIKPADPQVVYVPTYSPTVVYGVWAYPAYPPYYYYPPPPPAYPAYSFAAGVAVGVAWGYAWGNCNWHGNNVYINNNQNININNSINRAKYGGGGGDTPWRHDPSHRRNVAYRDGATAKQYGQSPSRAAEGRRDARGFGDSRPGGGGRGPSAGTLDRDAGQRGGVGARDRSAGQRGGSSGAGVGNRSASPGGGRDSAFSSGGFNSGRQERAASERGQTSRQSLGGGAPRGGGFGGGFGGGGGRGGGRR